VYPFSLDAPVRGADQPSSFPPFLEGIHCRNGIPWSCTRDLSFSRDLTWKGTLFFLMEKKNTFLAVLLSLFFKYLREHAVVRL